MLTVLQCCDQWPDWGGRRYQEGHKCLQQEDSSEESSTRDQAPAALSGPPQREQGRTCHKTCVDLEQITCLYDMDIPKPDNFNETYLYEG